MKSAYATGHARLGEGGAVWTGRPGHFALKSARINNLQAFNTNFEKEI
jgi:hypothetical protein